MSQNWNRHYGPWWAIQWQWSSWFSLGIHIDLKKRETAKEGIMYGPYIDLHLGMVILSIGRNPIYATDVQSMTYRSAFNGDAQ